MIMDGATATSTATAAADAKPGNEIQTTTDTKETAPESTPVVAASATAIPQQTTQQQQGPDPSSSTTTSSAAVVPQSTAASASTPVSTETPTAESEVASEESEEGATPAAATSKRKFVLPPFAVNPSGWGPVLGREAQSSLGAVATFSPLNQGDRLGRSADWGSTNRYQGRFQQERGVPSGTAPPSTQNSLFFKQVEDNEFRLVETPTRTSAATSGRFQQYNNRRTTTPQQQGRGRFTPTRGGYQQGPPRRGGFRGPPSPYRKTGFRFGYDRNAKQIKESALEVQSTWVPKEQVEFNMLGKMQADVPPVQDLLTCGHLCAFNRKYSGVSPANEQNLDRFEGGFSSVTTSEDPVLKELHEKGNVFATDAILGMIMCCPRSAYPWDIIVTRVGNNLYFDKRPDSILDLVTVNETSSEYVSPEDRESGKQLSLAREATYVNHMYSQQVLNRADQVQHPRPNPFPAQQGAEQIPVTYRYRQWNLDENIQLIARCQVHSTVDRAKGTDGYCLSTILLETEPKVTEWRKKLESAQRGVVLATELRNNSFRLARFTAQALLAGAPELNLGFVSRTSSVPLVHSIISTQMNKATHFASQMNIGPKNMWAILRKVIDMCLAQPPGKYVLMKDLSKPMVILYQVPETATFTTIAAANAVASAPTTTTTTSSSS
ncbi:eukaryotic translation initiation factor 3 subunit 7 [Pelomyxa schiedti]|nr:eukaryotic translation initiation factor 3 subunit 7 [Pelomyxa schiedti]